MDEYFWPANLALAAEEYMFDKLCKQSGASDAERVEKIRQKRKELSKLVRSQTG